MKSLLLVFLSLFILSTAGHIDACAVFDVSDYCSFDGFMAEDTPLSSQLLSAEPLFSFSEVLSSHTISYTTLVVSGIDRPPAAA